jgi:hypothetical protein
LDEIDKEILSWNNIEGWALGNGTMIIVVSLLAVWAAVGLYDYGRKFALWYRARKAKRTAQREIDSGSVPVDYDQVAELVRDANNAEDASSPDFAGIVPSPEIRKRLNTLNSMRHRVAVLRGQGFDKGSDHKANGMTDVELGLQSNPHDKGTGEAKQWARGYLMAQSIRDIKPWIDKA